jgi:glycosyltransferase involved in cell wall biosynthesis
MSNILVLTRCYPRDFDTAVYGLFQRFKLILHSINEINSEVNLVFIIEQSIIDAINYSQFSKDLCKKWGVNVRIHFLPIKNEPQKTFFEEYIRPIYSYKFHGIFSPASDEVLRNGIDKLINNETRLIVAHRLNSFFPIFGLHTTVPVILDLDDIEHKKLFRDLNQMPFWWSKLFLYLQIFSVLVGERRSINRSVTTFICSNGDLNYLSWIASRKKIQILPNSINLPDNISSRNKENVILFVGSYSYNPNIDAAEILIKNIFPKVKQKISNCELWLVGNKIERLIHYNDPTPGVKYLGFIDDLKQVYNDASIVCCPIRSGGGTRIKILEAAAFGLPVVSTSIGAEGLDFVNGFDIVIADSDDDLVASCINLLESADAASLIGKNARVAVDKYSKEAIQKKLTVALSEVVTRHHGR